MYIHEILNHSSKGVSFEFFPPKTDATKDKFKATLDVLSGFKPLYVSMTCGAGGSTQNYTKEAVDILLEKKELTVMPHITCIDLTESLITETLDYYKNKGIENFMLLRGDLPNDKECFDPSSMKFQYAAELIRHVNDRYAFSTAAAVYPEGHIETESVDKDFLYTLFKIRQGVNFAVTQMFFDNTFFYRFRDRVALEKIDIPILPGIFPLTDILKLKKFISIARTTIPSKIEEKMLKYVNNPEDMAKAGIEITVRQCRDLMANGVNFLHFFTFNNPSVMAQVLEALGFNAK